MKNFKQFLRESKYKQYITQEMEDHYIKRTLEHINRVRRNLEYLTKYFDLNDDQKFELLDIAKDHDQTKFQYPEKDLYSILSWKYHIEEDEYKKLNIPEWLQAEMTKITEHHVKQNAHHPEYHDNSLISGFLDPQDRDEVDDEVIVDATSMPKLNLLEMVCDWTAISQEMDKTSDSTDWANNNVNKRWKFNESQTKLIYDVINTLKESGLESHEE